jgi:hypothetical protein
MDFASLKRSRDQLAKINEQASKLNSPSFARDERYWKPELTKEGNGGAVIRFLPAPSGEEVPFVRKFSYGFKGPRGEWFIEMSPSTIGLPCPVMEYNSALWASGIEANKDVARRQKRRLGFISNILVLKHPARPSDEGKVFLFEFGKKIWDKLNDKMNPDDEEIEPVNPFDMWGGANFRLRIRQVEGFRNYDKSEFDPVSELADDDVERERIWKQAHSLQAEIAPSKFKSYDELKSKLGKVLGTGAPTSSKVAETNDDDAPWNEDEPKVFAPAPRAAPAPRLSADEDYISEFQRLADSV